MRISKLDSVCIWSDNPSKLADWYEKMLDLKIDRRLDLPDDTGINFMINDVFFFIGYHDKVKGKSKDPYRIMIGFSVDSVEKIYKELKAKGVEFVRPAEKASDPDDPYYVATAKDPEGNIIQFFSDNP